MTEEKFNKQMERLELKASADKLPENKRRRLIKGAVAVPVIMTLHSGAALARTSNLVGPLSFDDTAGAAKSDDGKLICVRPNGDMADLTSNPVDLGTNPELVNVTAGETLADQAALCQAGGGILVSGPAWSSIMPKIGGI